MDRRRRDPPRLIEWERRKNRASAMKRRPKSSASGTAKSSLKRTMTKFVHTTKFVQERGVRHRVSLVFSALMDRRRAPSAVDPRAKLEGAVFPPTGKMLLCPDNIETTAAYFEDVHLLTNDVPASFSDARFGSC
jgi:hypothetical protein